MQQCKWVVRSGGMGNSECRYLSADNRWVDYTRAKRFRTQDDADTAAQIIGLTDYGLFPCSVDKPG